MPPAYRSVRLKLALLCKVVASATSSEAIRLPFHLIVREMLLLDLTT
jgi:hypothetical protein